ncbi:zinc ribbon domain-containing protein [Clostridioides difficile]|uniref:hypothetical protein n=1 Tax=unclassified Clostridioides TaxID=2635829 RepID=UPI0016BC712C|nr:zinc ribbon domain-containing protein [Clostridioides difficile]
MTFSKKIKTIRIASLILLAIAVMFMAFNFYILGIITLLADWQVCRMHKCPNCGKYIDMRLSLDEMQYCPSCGYKLNI